jgi:hypothetical protein
VIFVLFANDELFPGSERKSAALANKTSEHRIQVLEYAGQVDA